MNIGRKSIVFIIFLIASISGFLLVKHFIFDTNIKTTNISKPASNVTKKKNKEFLNYLPFDDNSDFKDAKHGFIATLKESTIKNINGKLVYDLNKFNFITNSDNDDFPDTVNPSLWRHSKLTSMHGLFKVNENIYQIRGFDLANMTFIRSENGWIVVDSLTSFETAKAGLDLMQEHLGKIKIKAVIITHSHVDHFAGVKALLSDEQLQSGEVELIAPIGFMEESVSENLIAGNAMSRRSSYMYGTLLPCDITGSVGVGLGAGLSSGTVQIQEPTMMIDKKEPTSILVDGLELIFLNTPGAEAPAELMFYIPRDKALCQSEEINHTMHNLLTLRGAKVRSGLEWSKYIDKVIYLFGNEVEISFGSHHWPVLGNERILDFWKGQRDLYKYIHDETVRLANLGMTRDEIAEEIKLPDSIAKKFFNRGYYGALSHNAKSQYQMYFGFFTGNPEQLNPLPPVEAGKKFVEYMGGAKNIMKKAQKDYEKGEYRWVATSLNYLVFAEPDNQDAKNMLADSYEQMGYQSECSTWRNFYLTAAQELRNGVNKVSVGTTVSPDMISNLAIGDYLDYLAITLDHPKATKAKSLILNFTFTDANEIFAIFIENGVLNYSLGKHSNKADANISFKRSDFNDLNIGKVKLKDLIDNGAIEINGDGKKFEEFILLLSNFDFWFNIVTP